MSTQEHPTAPQTKKDSKVANRWNNISSDQDQSESEHSEKDVQNTQEVKEQQTPVVEEVKEEKITKPAIVPFDPKKKFRGEFAHLKTVKGGFKAQKLEKKKFHLDAVRNPFAMGNDQSSQEEEEKEQENAPVESQPEPEVPVEKVVKKTKKQQQKQELDALLKQLGANNEQKGEAADKKKKKAKKPKKVIGTQQAKAEGAKVEEVQTVQPSEQFKVDKETIEQVMRQKAVQAAKIVPKKNPKTAIVNASKKAAAEREAKNKNKKVYVDL